MFGFGGLSGQPGEVGGWTDAQATLPTDQWSLVALSYDGAVIRSYVNGVLTRSLASGGTLTPSASPLRMGRRAVPEYDRAFTGSLDEAQIYDRALSAGEIQAIYEADTAGQCSDQLCSTPPPALVAWYRMEGDSQDSQGPHDGTSTPAFTTGKVGQAATGAFESPDAPDLNPQRFTLAGWFTHGASGGSNQAAFLMAKSGPDGNHGFELDTRFNGSMNCYSNGGIDGGGAGYSGPVNDGQFHHAACTYDGTTIRLYVDGVEVAQDAYSGTVDYQAGQPLVIGSRTSGPKEGFPGLLDEVQLYERALTATEIKEIFDAGGVGEGNCAGCARQPANLAAWYKGDGNADDSIGTNHGALQNGASFADGIVGMAFSLDGVDDFVSIADVPSLNFASGDFAVNLWVNINDVSGEQVLVEKFVETMDAGGHGWLLTKMSDGRLRFALSPLNIVDSAAGVMTTGWHHVAAVRRGNTGEIFLDGQLIVSAANLGTFNVNSLSSVKIGHRGSPSDTPGSADTRGFFLKGLADELQIHGRALSAAEVERIYRAGSRGVCLPLPVAFGFTNRTGITPGTYVRSNTSTVTGLVGPAPLEISAGSQYRIDGGPWTGAAGATIEEGQQIAVRHISSSLTDSDTTTSLTIAGVAATFTSTTLSPGDTSPNPFSFTARNNAGTSTLITSTPLRIYGISAVAPVSVTGGEFRVHDGSAWGLWGTADGGVAPGNIVQVRHVSQAGPLAATHTDLTVGDKTGRFTSTTADAGDAVPDAFAFVTRHGVATASVVPSNGVWVQGLSAAAPIGVSNGQYRVYRGPQLGASGAAWSAWTSASGSIEPGWIVQVRHTSAATSSTSRHTDLTIGGVSGRFTSSTAP